MQNEFYDRHRFCGGFCGRPVRDWPISDPQVKLNRVTTLLERFGNESLQTALAMRQPLPEGLTDGDSDCNNAVISLHMLSSSVAFFAMAEATAAM